MSTLLDIHQINSGYGQKQVLHDISLQITEGEVVLLVGSNGSGKSTLFKVIYGLLGAWSGEVSFEGGLLQSPQLHTPASRLIGRGLMYIPQKGELYEDMSVRDNLYCSLLHLGNRSEIDQRMEEVLEQMPLLKNRSKQTAGRLSGGERKMLSLGMVMTNKPHLLLYDEPLAGLSEDNTEQVLSYIQKLKAQGMSIILIEHRIRELFNHVDRVLGLRLGSLYTGDLRTLDNIKQFIV